jgi:hypothetical protein
MADSTPQYGVFMTHYAAGTTPIAAAIAQGGDKEEAILRQVAAESPGVEADCGAGG